MSSLVKPIRSQRSWERYSFMSAGSEKRAWPSFAIYIAETRLMDGCSFHGSSKGYLPRVLHSTDDKVWARLLKARAKQPRVTRSRERTSPVLSYESRHPKIYTHNFENTRCSRTWSIIQKAISLSSSLSLPFSPFISSRRSRTLEFLCNVARMISLLTDDHDGRNSTDNWHG